MRAVRRRRWSTAFLTAFYTFRAYFLTFWGEERVPEEAGGHAHESPPVMTVPLMILAVVSRPASALVLSRCRRRPSVRQRSWRGRPASSKGRERGARTTWLMGVSSLVALAGIGLAGGCTSRQPGTAAQLAARDAGGPTSCRSNKFFIDELYDVFIVKPLDGLRRSSAHASTSTSSTASWTSSARCRACLGVAVPARCRTGWCSSTPWRWCSA